LERPLKQRSDVLTLYSSDETQQKGKRWDQRISTSLYGLILSSTRNLLVCWTHFPNNPAQLLFRRHKIRLVHESCAVSGPWELRVAIVVVGVVMSMLKLLLKTTLVGLVRRSFVAGRIGDWLAPTRRNVLALASVPTNGAAGRGNGLSVVAVAIRPHHVTLHEAIGRRWSYSYRVSHGRCS
jgi:hypothetical protein